MVRHYLWALGDWIKVYRPGELLANRYLLTAPKILLDTQPSFPPLTPDDIPESILPYLKLFPYRLHVPQVHGYLPSPDEQIDLDIWLLEYGTVPTQSSGELLYPQLLPELSQLWQVATPMRQLNWLWQMATLWQPLQSQQVVSSLLTPSLLRVNGSVLQLLELQADGDAAYDLKQLGELWSSWIAQASPTLAAFLGQLCDQLVAGQMSNPEHLIASLDRALFECGRSQQRSYKLFTCTDAGPTREHNEDACYPATQEVIAFAEQSPVLTIVCDGIGGQENGEIASQLAIETLLEETSTFNFEPQWWNPQRYTHELERAIATANDRISERNDSENRLERQRMGTTLVMSLIHAHEIYVAYVGDSRLYWITPTRCQQMTVDDDLASREVRLGYILYREAIQYPNAGALVKALGMSPSSSLYPTVERLVLDEDCVFLLCSDGLSDRDRVEQYWQTEVVPILQGETTVAEAGRRLLEIANQQNGHDNTTIALIHCQVTPRPESEAVALSLPKIEMDFSDLPFTAEIEETDFETTAPDLSPLIGTAAVPETSQSDPETPPATPASRKPGKSLLLAIPLGLLALAAIAAAYWFLPRPVSTPSPSESLPSPASPSPVATAESLGEPTIIKLKAAIQLSASVPPNPASPQAVQAVPAGSLLKILDKTPDGAWIEVQACQQSPSKTPPTAPEKAAPEPTAIKGWIAAKSLAAVKGEAQPKELDRCRTRP
jgi:protein phosphatase